MAPIDLHDVGGLLLTLSPGFHQPQDPAHSPNPAQGTDAKIPSCRLTPELATVPMASVSPRRLSVEWSGTARSRPSRWMTEPISPSVCRKANRNTVRKVSAVAIARGE